jgi:hypothetical protein
MKKKLQSIALFWFGLQDVGVLQIFYSRTIVDIFEGLEEKIAVCAQTNRNPNKQEVGFIFV